ncbi:hypothetical protein AB2M62_11395 [Sphingomonas sp. MMS12-HWE2-04]|uniref:hypothetical protein n=1 Tax=Sphingomonas sp. MMS12-HWE2-04 TaxID=3234199 RepID=UPI00385041FC
MLLVLSLLALQTPQILLTRSQAERMSPKELEALLLADFPHAKIYDVRIVTYEESPYPLQTILFEEEGQAAEGYFCTARRIAVTFDTLHGKVPQNRSELVPDAPRRRFAVSAAPLLAVLDKPATDGSCASVRKFAQMQMPAAAISRGRWYVEAVHALSRDAANGKVRVPITCVNETTYPHSGCDGERALAALAWASLGNVELPTTLHGQTTQLQFWGPAHWVIDVTGAMRVETVAMRRRNPPPF